MNSSQATNQGVLGSSPSALTNISPQKHRTLAPLSAWRLGCELRLIV